MRDLADDRALTGACGGEPEGGRHCRLAHSALPGYEDQALVEDALGSHPGRPVTLDRGGIARARTNTHCEMGLFDRKPAAAANERPDERSEPAVTPESQQAKVIAFANQKGGVAKTTTTLNLAAAFAEKGNRVLWVAMDPQGNLPMSQGIDPASPGVWIYDVPVLGKIGRDKV